MLKRTFLPIFLGGITLWSLGASPTMALSPLQSRELVTEGEITQLVKGCEYDGKSYSVGSVKKHDDGQLYVCVNDLNSGGNYAWRLQPK